MPKARSIRRRVKAIRNIRTITRTMEKVATVRFEKARRQAGATRPYTNRVTALVADMLSRQKGGPAHPLLVDRDVQHDILLVITSERGLCGPYNAAVLRIATERLAVLREAGYEVDLHVVGRRGGQSLRYHGHALAEEYRDFGYPPDRGRVRDLAEAVMRQFLDGRIDGLEVAYTQFISTTRQKAAISQVLPLSQLELPEPPLAPGMEQAPYEMCPSESDILDWLLPAAVRVRLYQCFLDAAASEQMARMTSMRSASESAEEMIRNLTTTYNRLRQAQITTELVEILGGRTQRR